MGLQLCNDAVVYHYSSAIYIIVFALFECKMSLEI